MASPAQSVVISPQFGGIDYQMLTTIVGWIGTISVMFLNATPIVLFYKIFKKTSTIEIIPESLLIFNVGCNILWFSYWFRLNVFIAGFSASIGATISIIFSLIFVYFIAGNIWKWLLYSFIILNFVVEMLYIFVYMLPAPTTGLICMIVNILTYAAPGQNLIQVIRKGDANMIPIVTVLVGTVCSISWMTFGLMKMDFNCIIPHSMGLALSIINIIVWAVFYCKGNKSDKPKEDDDEKGEKLDDKNTIN